MVYNNVINTLRMWCTKKNKEYQDKYEKEFRSVGNNPSYLLYIVIDELNYKLGTLIDKDFLDYKTFISEVKLNMDVHIHFSLKKELGKIENYYIQTAEKEFLEFFSTLPPDCPDVDCPYNRIVQGEEADRIADKFYEVWNYDTSYWYPLNGEEFDENKLWIMSKWVEPHLDEISCMLGLPEKRIYEFGESWNYDHINCSEVDKLTLYADSGCESAYADKDFSWIIFFSHEDTVTFGGIIVSAIKEILHAEREHWNRFEW